MEDDQSDLWIKPLVLKAEEIAARRPERFELKPGEFRLHPGARAALETLVSQTSRYSDHQFGGTSAVGGSETQNHVIPEFLGPIVFRRVDESSEEALLRERLDADSADAVIGDLVELFERDLAVMPEAQARRRRRSRARYVQAVTPIPWWRRILRSTIFSLEMYFYWIIAVFLIVSLFFPNAPPCPLF